MSSYRLTALTEPRESSRQPAGRGHREAGGGSPAAAAAAVLICGAVLCTALPAAAQTACERTGTATAVTVTCSGDQSGGIRSTNVLRATPTPFPSAPDGPDSITLNVQNLDEDIGDAGIDLRLGSDMNQIPSPRTFTADVDLGAHSIAASKRAIVIDWNLSAGRDTSITLRSRGTFSASGTVDSFDPLIGVRLGNGDTNPAGDADITLEEGSVLTAGQLGDGGFLVNAFAARGTRG